MDTLARWLTHLGVVTAHPLSFLVVAAFGAAWLVFEPHTLDWHGIATLATWFMTFLIQRAEHRDTQAIQGKLDELIRAVGKARNEITHLDELEPEEIERVRQRDIRGPQ